MNNLYNYNIIPYKNNTNCHIHINKYFQGQYLTMKMTKPQQQKVILKPQNNAPVNISAQSNHKSSNYQDNSQILSHEKMKQMMIGITDIQIMQLFCYSQKFKIILEDWSKFPQEMKMIELRMIYIIATILLKNQQSLVKLNYLQYNVTLGASDAIRISQRILSRVATQQGQSASFKHTKVTIITIFKNQAISEKDHLDLYSFCMKLWFDPLQYSLNFNFQSIEQSVNNKLKALILQNYNASTIQQIISQDQNFVQKLNIVKNQQNKNKQELQGKLNHIYHRFPINKVETNQFISLPIEKKSIPITQSQERFHEKAFPFSKEHHLFANNLHQKKKTLIQIDPVYAETEYQSSDSNFSIIQWQQEQKRKQNIPSQTQILNNAQKGVFKPKEKQPISPVVEIQSKNQQQVIQKNVSLSQQEKKSLDKKWTAIEDQDFVNFYNQSDNDKEIRQKMQTKYGKSPKWAYHQQINIRIRILISKVFSKFETLTTIKQAYNEFTKYKSLILGYQSNSNPRAKRAIFKKIGLLYIAIKGQDQNKNRNIARLVLDLNFICRKYYFSEGKHSTRR